MDKMLPSWTLIAQLIMFLGAMMILSRLLFKPMLAVFEKRRQLTEEPKEKAAELRKESAEIEQTVEEKIRAARGDADRLRDQLLSAAQKNERKTLVEAREQADKIAQENRQELNAAAQAARAELDAEINRLAEQLTNRLMKA